MAEKIITESILRKTLGEFAETITQKIEERIERSEVKAASEFAVVHQEIYGLKSDVAELKTDVSNLKEDMSETRSDLGYLKKRVDYLVDETTDMRDHHESRLVRLENHIFPTA